MCGVMVWELVSQNQAQGTPIAIKPNFNYMVSKMMLRGTLQPLRLIVNL